MTYSPEVQEDLNAAKYLLNKHGFAYRIWGTDDVRNRLLNLKPVPPHIEEIVKHVTEGDDWPSQSEETSQDDQNIWAIIDGTKHDHPEWFELNIDDLKEKAREWIGRHGTFIYEDSLEDMAEELELDEDSARKVQELVGAAMITINF